MSEVTDITGIGPAKADTLADAGYESVEDIASAEPDELAEVDGVGDDRALEFIVGAEDVLAEPASEDEPEEESSGDEFDLTPSEVSAEVEEAEEGAQDDVSASEDEDDESPSEDDEASENVSEGTQETETYPVPLDFDNKRQFDVFHAAVMRHHERHYTGNQPVADAMKKILGGLNSFEGASYELTEEELNALHSALSTQRTAYQGDNLISHMDEMEVVLNDVNEIRSEYLF